jgi:RHS repeat-associated protein
VSFGAVTVSRGTSAAVNPWRFSSEFTEDDSATMYYNYRHSESVTGRWISQDPAEEEGGIGLYVFAGNRPVLDNDSCGLKWNISRTGALFAEAYVDSEGDTFNDLASLVKLDVEDVSKWAHTNESLPVVCERYNIPNHVVFHFGAEKTGDTMFFSLFATLRRHRQDEVDAARKAGYKVSVLNNVNAQQISTALSSDGLYKYTFVGHGEYGSFINTYPDKEGLTVEPGRYTIYGISLLQLFSCNSADNDIRRRHTVGIKAKRVIKVWSSNVARAGWFIGYSGSPTALTEVFSWTPIRGTNGK